jgi:hypothetical protein
MKTMTTRVSRLEKRFAPHLDKQGRSLADVLRERMRRLAAAEGWEFEEDPVRDDPAEAYEGPLTIAEVLRSRFRRHPAALAGHKP